MEYLDHLETVTGAFERELRAADPAAACASIRWTTAQLAAHLGEVHRWAALNASTGKRNPRTNVPEIDVAPVRWYSESRRILLSTLGSLDASAPAYTLSAVDRTVAFWHRRQLFESLVLLWDLRSAISADAAVGEVAPAVQADGVSELFEVFLGRAPAGEPLGAVVALEAADTGDRWVIGPDWRLGSGSADAVISGNAADLQLYAWNRTRNVAITGDPAAVERFERGHFRP